ncbi:hypothetical protein ABS764_09505 [Flavobacterium sp. ST-87]|uniref:DUF4468 domain-containing protein n=1 Tax=Flavobacterium plantiphilum TaxID=3163297 RepID=A0ABW8XUQ9_9FLAO
MKKLFFVLFVYFLNFQVFAQKFKGYYITNSSDTIQCSFDVEVNIFDRKDFERYSVKNKVKILNNEGQKILFKPNEIQSFFIKGTKTGDYKFVSLSGNKFFYHELVNGKLSFYKVYRHNSGGALGALASEEYYLLKDEKLVQINPLNLRKGLGKQIEDYPELYQKWMDSNKYYRLNQFEEVVKLYNQHFEK